MVTMSINILTQVILNYISVTPHNITIIHVYLLVGADNSHYLCVSKESDVGFHVDSYCFFD